LGSAPIQFKELGNTVVTSETAFASQYTSAWRSLAPSMEDFVRRQNMDGYSRLLPPLPTSAAAPERRGVINEAAFIAFAKIAHLPRPDVGRTIVALMDDAFASAHSYVTDNVSWSAPAADVTLAEKREATAIAGRLYAFFARRSDGTTLTVAPTFPGSGLISACTGDVLIGTDVLYEVKSGDRPYRSVDYRQLAIYMALDFATRGKPFECIGVINPRRGTSVEVATEEFAREVAGQSAVSLCHSLIEAFSARLVSL
jgi:hypothetical protein